MAALRVPVTSNDHIQGSEDAAVTLVEYGDYECPHCGVAYHVVKQLQKHFGPALRFVFRNFPLAEIHPHAESAAEASEFAGANGASGKCTTASLKTSNVSVRNFCLSWPRASAYPLKIYANRWQVMNSRPRCGRTFSEVCAVE